MVIPADDSVMEVPVIPGKSLSPVEEVEFEGDSESEDETETNDPSISDL